MLGSTYTVGKPSSLHIRKQYYDGSWSTAAYKHGQVRRFYRILTKIDNVDKDYQVQTEH